ncbi:MULTISPECIES: hypothetical protein [Clostridium]|uniref:Uncharacterized protein n=1 Tax=Clostridium cibarium TaxID=2762247 RepID=A0ABR8PR62_9CLOT|nr:MULTISPECIES: hypothetical protein [Clostridium]MBD7910661.1 hypothetical protein [Clostridium cibarium]
MRYTRYDYKRKSGENFFLWLILIIILSIVLGVGGYRLLIGDKEIVKEKESVKQEDSSVDGIEKSFGIIQCGLYSNKNNAELTMKSIPEEYSKAIIEENGSFKIIAGIYSLEDSETKSQELTKGSISNFRISCKLDGKEVGDRTESEIIDGYIKIINKLYEKDVKSIDTKEFKAWVNSVSEKVSDKSDEFNLLFNNVRGLPDELKKENTSELLVFLYNIIIKYKQN